MTTLVLLVMIFCVAAQELPLFGRDGVKHLRQRVLHAQRDGGHRRPSPVSSVHLYYCALTVSVRGLSLVCEVKPVHT